VLSGRVQKGNGGVKVHCSFCPFLLSLFEITTPSLQQIDDMGGWIESRSSWLWKGDGGVKVQTAACKAKNTG
jgi:hypothetical protein